jgi:thioredoxin 1
MKNTTDSRIRRSHAMTFAGLAACAVLVLVAGGCGGAGGESRVMDVSSASLYGVIADTSQPVLVDFYKDGCPFCVALDPTLDELSKEYAGRVSVNKFMIMTAYWAITSFEIKDKYDIALVPTVLLFDRGVEIKRWPVIYGAGMYRPDLDKVLKARAEGKSAKEVKALFNPLPPPPAPAAAPAVK